MYHKPQSATTTYHPADRPRGNRWPTEFAHDFGENTDPMMGVLTILTARRRRVIRAGEWRRYGAWPLPGSFGWKIMTIVSTFSIHPMFERLFLIRLTQGSSLPAAGSQATG